MFLLAFSFANFEMTRGSIGKANISFNYTALKKLLLNCQILQMKKRGETFFGECMLQKGKGDPVHGGKTCSESLIIFSNILYNWVEIRCRTY